MPGLRAASPTPAAATLERPRATRRGPAEAARQAPRSWADLAGVGFLLVLAVAFISPAFWQGTAMGPFDVAARASSLTHGLYHGVHNALSSDQVTELLPWGQLNWEAVHHLQVPLWNSFSGDGMPLLFNFQAASFSLPHLIGYLFPLRDSFLASVAATLALAGTGSYVCARVLGAGALAGVLGAAVFELCGPLAPAAAWPLAGVAAWAGWLLAFCLLAYRHRRLRWVVALALSGAFAVYAGSPEMLALVVGTLVVFVVVMAALALATRAGVRPGGVLRVLVGSVLALGLSAPLWLPGAQVIQASTRGGLTSWPSLPASSMAGLLIPGYYGWPLGSAGAFGPLNFYASATYVGIPALVLAVVALAARRPPRHVVALGITAVVLVVVTWELWPVPALLQAAPAAGAVKLWRASYPLAFVVGLLAALGAQRLLERRGRAAYVAAAGGTTVVLALLYLRGGGTWGLGPHDAAIRRQSFFLPLAAVLVLLAIGAALAASPRPRRGALRAGVGAMVVVEAAFLLLAGVSLDTFGHRYFPTTPALAALHKAVGGSLVALDGGQGPTQFPGVGLAPETNAAYGVRELALYDPLIPAAYFSSWAGASHTPRASGAYFVPDVASARQARRYGAGFILVAPGRPAPPGTVSDGVFAGERLYRVPTSARFSFGPGAPGDAVTSAVATSDHSWHLTLDAARAATLRAHIVALPGWHASIDGHPASLRKGVGTSQVLGVPSGRHVVDLWYWPTYLSYGLLLAGASLAALCLMGVVALAAGPESSLGDDG